jgi:hypothetical protein
MRKLENELEKQCCKWAREKHLLAVKLEKNGHTGIPDRLFDDGVKSCYVEFKKPNGGVISAEQKVFAIFFKNRHFFINDFEDFKIQMTHFFDL